VGFRRVGILLTAVAGYWAFVHWHEKREATELHLRPLPHCGLTPAFRGRALRADKRERRANGKAMQQVSPYATRLSEVLAPYCGLVEEKLRFLESRRDAMLAPCRSWPTRTTQVCALT
jgi:hypothetical protein